MFVKSLSQLEINIDACFGCYKCRVRRPGSRIFPAPVIEVAAVAHHVGDLVEEADVTYAGGFPEDYSDVFGAPAAALPAF